jgi:small redox-active disulfide protein 2
LDEAERAAPLSIPRAAGAQGGFMENMVLGPVCANSKRLYAEAEKAVAQSGRPATITKVEAMEDIIAHGILRTPGLVIDGKVVASGRVPSAAEILTMMTAVAAEA